MRLSGPAPAGGTDTSVQVNKLGVLSGAQGFTWNDSTKELLLSGAAAPVYTVTVDAPAGSSGPLSLKRAGVQKVWVDGLGKLNSVEGFWKDGVEASYVGHTHAAYLSDAPSDGTTYGRRDGSWYAVAGTSPAGSTTQVQFNSSGSFGASADFTCVTAGGGAMVNVGGAISGTVAGAAGLSSQVSFGPGATTLGWLYGASTVVNTTGGSGLATSAIVGSHGAASLTGGTSATQTGAYGGYFSSSTSYTIGSGTTTTTSVIGVFAQAGATTTTGGTHSITSLAALRGAITFSGTGSASITNLYGLHLSAPAGTFTATNRYGVYQEDTSATNYFGGSIVAATLTSRQITINTGSANNVYVNWTNSGTSRWIVALNGSETGGNAGSDLAFNNYNDAGGQISTPLLLKRDTNEAVFAGVISQARNSDSNYICGSSTAGGLAGIRYSDGGTAKWYTYKDASNNWVLYAATVGAALTVNQTTRDAAFGASISAAGRNNRLGGFSGITCGWSSTDYPDIAFNSTRDATTTQTYAGNDYARRIYLGAAIKFQLAASGTAGNTITWTDAVTIGATGGLTVGSIGNDLRTYLVVNGAGDNTAAGAGVRLAINGTSSPLSYIIQNGLNVSSFSGGSTGALQIGTAWDKPVQIATDSITRATFDTSGGFGVGVVAATSTKIAVGRIDSSLAGGRVAMCRASDNTEAWHVDVYGSTSTPSLRIFSMSGSATYSTPHTLLTSGEFGLLVTPTADNGLLQLKNGTTKATGVAMGTSTFFYQKAAGNVVLEHSNTTVLTIHGTSNVYAGVEFLTYDAVPNSTYLYGSAYGLEIISASGNSGLRVGFTTNANNPYKLWVNGEARIDGHITAAKATAADTVITVQNTAGSGWMYMTAGGSMLLGTSSSTALYIRTGNTNAITVSTSQHTTFAGNVGFNGTTAIAKPTISGSRGGNAALASLLTALANYGLITDSTSA